VRRSRLAVPALAAWTRNNIAGGPQLRAIAKPEQLRLANCGTLLLADQPGERLAVADAQDLGTQYSPAQPDFFEALSLKSTTFAVTCQNCRFPSISIDRGSGRLNMHAQRTWSSISIALRMRTRATLMITSSCRTGRLHAGDGSRIAARATHTRGSSSIGEPGGRRERAYAASVSSRTTSRRLHARQGERNVPTLPCRTTCKCYQATVCGTEPE